MKIFFTLLAMLAAVDSFAQGTAIRSQNGFGTNTTLRTPTVSLNNGSTATTVTFPPTSNTNTDQVFYVTGSPFTSGASVGFKMTTTNPIAGNIDANGYYNADQIAMNVGMIGMQGPNFDTPMMGYMIANSPWPLGILHAHSGYNTYNIMTVGDTTNGDLVEIPYESGVVGTVPHQPLTTGFSVGGTNIYFQASTVSKLFEVNQNNGNVEVFNPASGIFTVLPPINTSFGQVFKANGRLNTANAIDPADLGPANFGVAIVKAATYLTTGTASTNGYFSSDQSGWNTDGSGGMFFQSSGTGEFFVDNTGIYPRLATSGLLQLGLSRTQAWGLINTTAIATSGTATGNITATGYTNINGTNIYVNVIGTAVAVTIKNNAGTAVATNTVVTGGTIIPLQAGGSISAASGLSGTWWVQ